MFQVFHVDSGGFGAAGDQSGVLVQQGHLLPSTSDHEEDGAGEQQYDHGQHPSDESDVGLGAVCGTAGRCDFLSGVGGFAAGRTGGVRRRYDFG